MQLGLLPFLFWQVARTECSFLNSSIMRIPTPAWGLTGLGGLGDFAGGGNTHISEKGGRKGRKEEEVPIAWRNSER
jgi:hypothetical protein